MERLIKNREAMTQFAAMYIDTLVSTPLQATTIALSGDLGSGKTAFTKGVALHLGIKEEVLSPTFVIAKFYEIKNRNWKTLVHIDAYRIEHIDELRALKWDSIIADPNNLVVVEWPELIACAIPDAAQQIGFIFIDEHTRKVIV